MSGFVIDFLVVRTKTNFIDGLAFGTILMVMGVHAAVLWGVLTFLCGYVPYLGLLLAALPATFFAWLHNGLPGAVALVVAALVRTYDPEPGHLTPPLGRSRFRPSGRALVLVFGRSLALVGLPSPAANVMLLVLVQVSEETRWINVKSAWTNSSRTGTTDPDPRGSSPRTRRSVRPGFSPFPGPAKKGSPCRRVLRAVAVPPTRHAAFVSGRPRLLPSSPSSTASPGNCRGWVQLSFPGCRVSEKRVQEPRVSGLRCRTGSPSVRSAGTRAPLPAGHWSGWMGPGMPQSRMPGSPPPRSGWYTARSRLIRSW